MRLILLPIYILKFWYLEAPLRILTYFIHLDIAFVNLFSLPLMLRTFFKPWKNEYRKGLVGFSIFMGMVFKSMLIIFDLTAFSLLLVFEAVLFIAFLSWPIATLYLPFFNF